MLAKAIVIILAAALFAYFANLSFQGEFAGSQAVNDFFLGP